MYSFSIGCDGVDDECHHKKKQHLAPISLSYQHMCVCVSTLIAPLVNSSSNRVRWMADHRHRPPAGPPCRPPPPKINDERWWSSSYTHIKLLLLYYYLKKNKNNKMVVDDDGDEKGEIKENNNNDSHE